MPEIYFEKQVAAMCGQHLLNNLLQGEYFDPAGLASIAQELDAKEQELGLSVDALRGNSQNVDLSGNFSIQVLDMALERTFQIRLSPATEDLNEALRLVGDSAQPEKLIENTAFVFNLDNHWFCARYLHHQFWVLNSLENEPQPVSRTMLAMFVKQMQIEGWSVFVTLGRLPALIKREEGARNWFVFGEDGRGKEEVKKIKPFEGKGYSLKSESELDFEDDPELMQAMRASLLDFEAASAQNVILEEEPGPDVKEAFLIQLILPPSGKRVRRKFRPTSRIEQILAWANTLDDVTGKIRSIQRSEDRSDIVKSDAVSTLGNGCSLRVVVA